MAAWWLATLVVAAVTALIGTRAVTRRRWAPALAALAVLVAGAHLVHAVGSALIVEDRSPARRRCSAPPGRRCWPGCWRWSALPSRWPGRAYGPLLCALSGGVFALVSAFSGNNFGSAVLPFAGPADLDRAAVVLTLGGGAGCSWPGSPRCAS